MAGKGPESRMSDECLMKQEFGFPFYIVYQAVMRKFTLAGKLLNLIFYNYVYGKKNLTPYQVLSSFQLHFGDTPQYGHALPLATAMLTVFCLCPSYLWFTIQGEWSSIPVSTAH